MPVSTQHFDKIYLEVLPDTAVTKTFATLADHLTIARIEQPSYEFYRLWHDRVGAAWGWHLRARINDRSAIEKELAHPLTEMGLLVLNKKEVGYYLVVGELADNLEISDFGFAPEHCGKKLGSIALPILLGELFSRQTKRIWLSTRSTNDPKVVRFYKKFGFQEYKRETITA